MPSRTREHVCDNAVYLLEEHVNFIDKLREKKERERESVSKNVYTTHYTRARIRVIGLLGLSGS